MIVVDTNVISYFWLPGDYAGTASELFKNDPEWVAPFLWRSEFRSVLALYIRKMLLSADMATKIIYEAEKMFLGREYFVKSDSIIDKLSSSKLSAYDLEYIVLAESLGIKLVTLDRKILSEFPDLTINLKKYS